MPVAVVTGAGSGIGRAVARELLAGAWQVALLGRREAALAQTASEAGASSPQALVIPTDVTDRQAVASAFDQVKATFGRLDLLFDNAGRAGPRGTVDELDLDEWDRTVATNLTGMLLCARHAFALMRAQDPQGGRILNNGSISAHSPRPGSAAYTATKHAVTGLTKAISLDGRPFRISCGQLDIGNAATEMTARMASGTLQADGSTRPEPTFDVVHVARAVRHIAELPLEVTVDSLVISASGMPFVGRG